MHPDLLNNSLFLKYYQQWQDDPTSIVFVPIAEYFLLYGMVDEALKVCREGLKRHPVFVTGRVAMAKIHLKRGNWDEAEGELRQALSIMPANRSARELLRQIEDMRHREDRREAPEREEFTESEIGTGEDEIRWADTPQSPSWNTVTMAKIYASQGLYDKARTIYRSILARDPQNETALSGLKSLP